ncbi:ankyrin repeat-containing protein BDA1-like isoform X2 [Camellia sinensis]|uniref:ankyrin repeat-containing protein BDA1-like isoform X2 n=1 Tax=Camellia sinensis TaxID=4442 RepID=UPI0010355E6B|nr:ankyrin repeat-containing protein BDA1-like isoform X2 [Camellia sinensis]
MASTQQRLITAADEGDINGLYVCIREDPHILDKIDDIPFVDTPLHRAAAAGSTDFASEMMNLKPSFGMKLNPGGLSPLHLALRNRHFETVRQLISFDKELIRVKGRQSYTALHYVALRNEFDWLAEFLCACPAAIEDRTIRGETALHIAVRRSNSEAFEVLLGWMRRTHRRKILNWTDNEGNTVLHIAVFTLQPQIVKSILDQNYINRNAQNFEGLTARDFAIELGESEARREILDMLFSESLHGANINNTYSLGDFLKSGDDVLEGICGWIFRVRSGLSLGDPFLSLVRLVLSVLEVIHGWIARLGRSMNSAIYKRPLIPNLLLVICMIPVAIKIFITITSTFGLSLPSRLLDNNHSLPISNTTAYNTANGEAVTFGKNFLLLFYNEVAFCIALLIMMSLLFRSSIVFLFCLMTIWQILHDYISTSLSAGDIIDSQHLSALVFSLLGFFVISYWNEMIHSPTHEMKRFQMLQSLFDELN